MAGESFELIIFDCDGVLVDSEPLSVEVLTSALEEIGVEMSEEEVYRRFLGRSLSTVFQVVKDEHQTIVDEAFFDRMRVRLFERFRADLQPIPGIAGVLDALKPKRCVASSSQIDRIRLSLDVTGLLGRLDPHIFSATMVRHGKPAPDLFLLAAERMGVAPERCVVIEDSPAGIQAAKAAGMTAFAFTGGSHAQSQSHRAEIAQLSPDATFDAMPDLVHLVQNV